MTLVTMRQVTATRFEAQCLALFDEAAAGEEIVVTSAACRGASDSGRGASEPTGSVTFHVDDDALIEPLDAESDAAS